MRRAEPHLNSLAESMIRQYLRDSREASYCARCLAAALLLNEPLVRAALGSLLGRGPFAPAPCHFCGARGLHCASPTPTYGVSRP